MSSISRTRLKRYIVNLEPGRAFDFTAGCFLPRRSETAWNRRREGRVFIRLRPAAAGLRRDRSACELLPVFVETTT